MLKDIRFDLYLLTSIDGYAATSPRRWTPPLRQASPDTSPVSSGEHAPKGKASKVRLYSVIDCFKKRFHFNLINKKRKAVKN